MPEMAFLTTSFAPKTRSLYNKKLPDDSTCHRTNGGPSLFKSRKNTRSSTLPALMVAEVKGSSSGDIPANASAGAVYSGKNMTVEEFFEKSLGDWKSQRSSHNLVWGQFEAVTSEIKIDARSASDSSVIELCEQNSVNIDDVILSLSMSWEGESDWDDNETMSGSTVMSVVKDTPTTGRLLRSMGYAEEIPAVGTWEMTADGTFVLTTSYDAAAAEERIWFATPDLRMRVSQIRTSSGRGVVTASFSTEIRKLILS